MFKIRIEISDFPVEHRTIYPLNVAYLNYNNLQSTEVKSNIARAVDYLMSLHAKDKGIIHTTSYEQLNFIRKYISDKCTKTISDRPGDTKRRSDIST